MGKAGKRTWKFTAEHVIPQTDKECRFSLAHSLDEKKPVCTPRKHCAFRFKVRWWCACRFVRGRYGLLRRFVRL